LASVALNDIDRTAVLAVVSSPRWQVAIASEKNLRSIISASRDALGYDSD